MGECAHEQPPQYGTGNVSVLVEIITPPLLAPLEESNKKPMSVTVMVELDARVAFKIVIIIEETVGEVTIPVALPLINT